MSEMIKTIDVTKRFGGLVAVNKVNLTVEDSTIVGLIGPNGAGKTTLFNLLSGYYPSTSGQIIFQGEDITRLPVQAICKRGIARTFQVVQPFEDLNVLDNVKSGAYLHTNSLEEAEAIALNALQIVDFPVSVYQTASSLNLSQKKRMEMARALATKPKLLLLDEVMAGLNDTEVTRLIKIIGKIRSELNITIIAVEHVMKAIMAISDHIIVLDHGEKIADWTPQEVAVNEKVIQAYLGLKNKPPIPAGN